MAKLSAFVYVQASISTLDSLLNYTRDYENYYMHNYTHK